MKVTRSAWALAAISMAISICAGCKVAPDDVVIMRGSSDVESIVRDQEAAWNRGDVGGFMHAGYWESPDLTFFSGGDDTRGFEPVLARYVKRYKTGDAEMGKLAFTKLEVVPLGMDARLVRGRWDLHFEKQPDVGGLFTLVFRYIDRDWRIVHDHTSVAK